MPLYSRKYLIIASLSLALLSSIALHGQDAFLPVGFVEVKLDFLNQQVKDRARVPFGVPTVFTADADKLKTDLAKPGLLIEMYLMKGLCASLNETDLSIYKHSKLSSATWLYRENGLISGNSQMNWQNSVPLVPNRNYCLVFAKSDPNPDGSSTALGPIMEKITLRPRSSLADHIKSDFGIGYVPKIKGLVGVINVHFYFVAINNDADLGYGELSRARQVFSRLSLFVGLAPLTFSSESEQEIKNITKLGNLVYGVGIRSLPYWPKRKSFMRLVFQPMRINVGFMRFIQDDANPLVTDNRYKNAPFVSITYDLNISTLLGPIGKLFQ